MLFFSFSFHVIHWEWDTIGNTCSHDTCTSRFWKLDVKKNVWVHGSPDGRCIFILFYQQPAQQEAKDERVSFCPHQSCNQILQAQQSVQWCASPCSCARLCVQSHIWHKQFQQFQQLCAPVITRYWLYARNFFIQLFRACHTHRLLQARREVSSQ